MVLCQMCQDIPDDLLETYSKLGWKRFYVHHPSFDSLELSARNGCSVCQCILNTFGEHPDWGPNWEKRNLAYRCDEIAWKGDIFTPQKVGPQENVASSDDCLPMFCMLRTKERFRIAYRLGARGVCLFFDVVTTGKLHLYKFSPLHQSSFDLASRWISHCTDMHGSCSITYDTVFNPTRLVDVGHKGRSPRLIEIKGNNNERCQYVSLSHCWGTSMPRGATTTQSTLLKRLSRIPIRTLPRTFRDAIIATRKLGIRYIWIDSLCIIQDEPTDWEHESGLMGKVYSHSYCMLAAVSSQDCHGGLFASRGELPILIKNGQSLLLKPYKEHFDPQRMLQNNPLSQRGWTLQEWELAPKVIYFLQHEMFFECREGYGYRKSHISSHRHLSKNEDEVLVAKVLDESRPRRCLDPISHLQRSLGPSDFQLNLDLRYDMWRKMVEGYSRRLLTNASDRFPALSGLASEYSFLLDDRYIAGLWWKDLIRGLCWRSQADCTTYYPAQNYGPSWSWAKMNGPILNANANMHPLPPSEWGSLTIIGAEIMPEGLDPHGTLVSGRIRLRGHLYSLTQGKSSFWLNNKLVKVFWDFLPRKNVTYSFLNMECAYHGLVLEDVAPIEPLEHLKHYRRVGIVIRVECGDVPINQSRVEELILV